MSATESSLQVKVCTYRGGLTINTTSQPLRVSFGRKY